MTVTDVPVTESSTGTAADSARLTFTDSRVSTPRLRSTARRTLFWVIVALLVIIFTVATLALTGTTQDKDRLSATNPHSNGAEAVISVLRDDGIDVSTPSTIATAERLARTNPGTTTLVVYDPASILSPAQYRTLRSVAGTIVLVEPDTAALDALAPGVEQAGAIPSTTRSAGCTFAPARGATTVSGLARGYRIGDDDATGCFGGSGVYALVHVRDATGAVTVVGATTTFTNGSIEHDGNAALGLRLFGQQRHLVWYLPTLADSSVKQDGVIPNPSWVIWVVVLAGIVLVAAGIWRGRRFGPVVIERMPVFVRASETLEGRARLYQRSSARTHALDALRIGAIGRMATQCGLPTRAGLDDVIGAVARITGRPTPDLRSLLVDAVPTTDAQLLELSDRLARLEADVARAVR